jgi:hypothetical protein
MRNARAGHRIGLRVLSMPNWIGFIIAALVVVAMVALWRSR